MSDVKPGTVLTIDSSTTLTQQHYILSLFHLGTLSRCLATFVESGFANIFKSSDGTPIEVAELAKRSPCDENCLRRILSFLASFGILAEHEGNRFTGTDLSDLLRDDHENSLASLIRFTNSRPVQMAILDMGYSLETGRPSFQHVNGSPIYEYMSNHSDLEKSFDEGIHQFTKRTYSKLSQEFDFSRFGRICEIAGGRGGFLLEILLRHKRISAVLFEREAALANILEELKSKNFENRFQAVRGNALDKIDVEADLFIIANTLFNFDESSILKILGNITEAMKKSQKQQEAVRLLIVDPDMGELAPNEPSTLKRGIDVLMMTVLGGRMRKQSEWQSLLGSEKLNLEIITTIKLPPFHCAYECKLA